MNEVVSLLRDGARGGSVASSSYSHGHALTQHSPAFSAATPTSTHTVMDGMVSHPLSASASSDSTLPPIKTPPNGAPMYGRSVLPGRPPTRESFHQPFANPNGGGVVGGSYQGYTSGTTLPPIHALQSGTQQSYSHTHLPAVNESAARFSHHDSSSSRRPGSRSKRPADVPSSNVTSANSSDDEGDGTMGASGLVAPLEVLRGLADEAVKKTEDKVTRISVM
jgi:hypothetical protein